VSLLQWRVKNAVFQNRNGIGSTVQMCALRKSFSEIQPLNGVRIERTRLFKLSKCWRKRLAFAPQRDFHGSIRHSASHLESAGNIAPVLDAKVAT